MPEQHECGTCARYTPLNDGEGHCSRYDCDTPAEFLDDWGYCWQPWEKDEEEEG